MKKSLYIILLTALLLSGCEKKISVVAPKTLYKVTNGVTADGIQIGDSPETFIKAYKNYTIQVAHNDFASNYAVMSIKKIPYEKHISTMIANFFIDGEPTSEADLCKINSVQPSELFALLSSPAYLKKHNVIYRYLRFLWEDGKIAEIESEQLNYNESFDTPKLD